MTESGSPAVLGYEPRAAFAQHADPAIADCQGKRIGILVVTYNALSTLIPVLKRIPPSVWSNVEEVVVFDDASQDGTFELAMGVKAVCDVRMMRTYGGPLKGGMPLYKYAGNRILTILENRALGLELTEFHSGYRAYNLHALAQIDFSRMTNDFHFDTEIIVKLHHQAMKIREVPIPTYYGTELCNVDGLKYARDVVRSVWRYRQTCRSVMRAPEFAEYFVHYPIKHSKHSSHYYARQLVGRDQDVLDVGCGEGFFAAELKKDGNRIVGVDALPSATEHAALERYISADLNAAQPELARQAGEHAFDRVLLLDVLEHLVQPERLL